MRRMRSASMLSGQLILFCVMAGLAGCQLPGSAMPSRRPPAPTATTATNGGVWQALHRPLRMPTVAAGAPCPAAIGHLVTADFGLALGDGPIYPIGPWDNGAYPVHGAANVQGWYELKVLWISRPEFTGPILIRGQRVDGTDGLRFSLDGTSLLPEMELETRSGGVNANGWSDWPSYILPRAPGCYAYQVDGLNISEVIVFLVVA